MTPLFAFEDVSVDLQIYDHQSLRLFKKGVHSSVDKLRIVSNRLNVSALKNISFSYQQGDRVGLIGRNGSGKSTLLKTISGIYEPTSGKIINRAGNIELLDTGSYIKDDLNGYECIEYFSMVNGLTLAEAERVKREVEEYSELDEFLKLPVRTYSAGMRTRISAILVTSLKSQVICIDEGIGAVDEKYQKKINQRLEEKIQESGIVFFASHDESLLRKFCNSALVLDSGSIVASGTVDHCFEFYREL